MATNTLATPWIAYARPSPQARIRLFCFHYAGGSAGVYRAWTQELPPAIEVCPVQLPGRESRLREPPFSRLEPLLAALAEALLPAMNLPFAFFGHSMGALVGFELARHLRRTGQTEPIYLGVSAYGAPQLAEQPTQIYQLPDAEFKQELRHLNGTPAEVLEHAELMEILLPILRADFAVIGEYRYVDEPPLSCPIAAFGGLEDSAVPPERLEPWREQTRANFSLHRLPGDHFFLNSSRAAICKALALDLRSSY